MRWTSGSTARTMTSGLQQESPPVCHRSWHARGSPAQDVTRVVRANGHALDVSGDGERTVLAAVVRGRGHRGSQIARGENWNPAAGAHPHRPRPVIVVGGTPVRPVLDRKSVV